MTHVLPDSPASKAGLCRHDILLEYDGEKIRDGNHLARLIRGGKENQRVALLLLRGGRERKVSVKLGLGPVLQVAGDARTKEPPGVAKPGGPAAVTVTAVPMDGNRMKVTFEYSDSGKYRSVTCSGNAEEIDGQIGKLPTKVQTLAKVAVDRLRKLELQKPSAYSPRR